MQVRGCLNFNVKIYMSNYDNGVAPYKVPQGRDMYNRR